MTLRKISFSILTLVLAFILTACNGISSAGDGSFEPGSYKNYRALIGQPREDVIEELDADLDSADSDKGIYKLPRPEKFDERDYEVQFLFDLGKGTLYGFHYSSVLPEEPEQAAAASEQLLAKLTSEHGAPDTYPEITGRLSEEKDLEGKLAGTAPFEAQETWVLDPAADFVLNLRVSSDGAGHTVIVLEYQTERLPK